MNWADFFHADSDVIIFGLNDILLFDFDLLVVHCGCTFRYCVQTQKVFNFQTPST